MEMEKKKVCVTGAGGFLASWIVKLFLSKGYLVHGTMRDPRDEKYAYLNKLERASDNLKAFKADLLDYDSLQSAITGCAGFIPVACLVPTSALVNPEERACTEAKVKRVVHISSVAAFGMIPNWPKDRFKDETCWSDKEYCRATEAFICLKKIKCVSVSV
ncbi:hypothetical protein CDL15_Pgr012241 [Punica granatum]|uniref:NAD(P)-binding domain-containing protein n=1 Tax=Punica granatum TaxID=22663 RepID=A0A218XNC1_PUNGR|nr:hypothetical protein CDL15_Pgr012241 [Punica granatum]